MSQTKQWRRQLHQTMIRGDATTRGRDVITQEAQAQAKKDPTQRNATQRNTTQRNTTQRNQNNTWTSDRQDPYSVAADSVDVILLSLIGDVINSFRNKKRLQEHRSRTPNENIDWEGPSRTQLQVRQWNTFDSGRVWESLVWLEGASDLVLNWVGVSLRCKFVIWIYCIAF